MSRPARPATVAAGIALILIVNLALLGAAAWNRRGEPAEFVLTERELALPLDRQEATAGIELSLRLTARAPDLLQRAARTRRADLPRLEHPWFDREKLRELGFSVDVDPTASEAARHYSSAQFRRAWVAVEYDGDAWSRWMERRASALEQLRRQVDAGAAEANELTDGEAQLAFDRVARSRLVPLDAGLNASELQERYADCRRIVVLPAWVRPVLAEPEEGPPVILGRVGELLVQRVQVPRRHRELLAPLMPAEDSGTRLARQREQAREGWPTPTPPRYRAVLAVGRGHAPWLVRVEALEPGGADN